MNELALFAGAGGGLLGSRLIGWHTICAVEINAYCRKVLFARQKDGMLERFPIWDDVRTFDGKAWKGEVDIITGGFPCQDISDAGTKTGIKGEKSGLWKEMARIISEVRPKYVFVENVAALLNRGMDIVLGDLSTMGYDARWGIVGAHQAGAPHRRKRVWILAHPSGFRCTFNKNEKDIKKATEKEAIEKIRHFSNMDGISKNISEILSYSNMSRQEGQEWSEDKQEKIKQRKHPYIDGICWWYVEPKMGRVADGVAHRVDKLKALGNGQVPQVVKIAWNILRRMT